MAKRKTAEFLFKLLRIHCNKYSRKAEGRPHQQKSVPMKTTTSIKDYGENYHNRPPKQLEFFNLAGNLQKPQIASIPGTSPKQRDRYRVVLGGQILGERLTIDQAIALAKRGGRNAQNLPKSDFYS